MVIRPYILGLDLHGTLLEPGEVLRPEMIPPLQRLLRRLADRTLRFICTGNDLAFVHQKLPSSLLAEIDGCVLETGCAVSRDNKTEQVITSAAEQAALRELEKKLRAAAFPQINYFAHRLTTISMFCDDPRGFFETVRSFLRPTPFFDLVHITYSSVAVDILPKGYNKFKGLLAVADGRRTIGIADSMNDRALLQEADFALAPANLAPELLPLLQAAGRSVLSLQNIAGLLPAAVLVASRTETAGVIEILEFLDRRLH